MRQEGDEALSLQASSQSHASSPAVVVMVPHFDSLNVIRPHTIIIGLRHHGDGVVYSPAGLRDHILRMLQIREIAK